MMKPNDIDYSNELNDYLINGKPLLEQLKKHERVDPSDYMPAVLGQPGSSERLPGKAEPDLSSGHVALYLCGHLWRLRW